MADDSIPQITRPCRTCKWSGLDEAEIPLYERRNPLVALRRQTDPARGWLCLHPKAASGLWHDLVNGGPRDQHARMSCAEARMVKHPNQYTMEDFWCGADGRYFWYRDNLSIDKG
jgi:hypothetical protein